jgi:hypothetical protein
VGLPDADGRNSSKVYSDFLALVFEGEAGEVVVFSFAPLPDALALECTEAVVHGGCVAAPIVAAEDDDKAPL